MGFFWTIDVLVVALAITWRYLGSYMANVFEGRVRYFAWAERPFYRMLGTSPDQEQTWKRYATSAVIFSGVMVLVGYLLLRLGAGPEQPVEGALGPAEEMHPSLEDGRHVGTQVPPGDPQQDHQDDDGPEEAHLELLGLEHRDAEIDEHHDGDAEQDALGDGHTRSRAQIRASPIRANPMMPSTTRKSAMEPVSAPCSQQVLNGASGV